jgi:Raf kinase inhibitor-like YbhB/YbcL family protein
MIQIESPALSEGAAMPTRFTCDGENVSPPLRWSGVPEDATELRISLTDPDAPRGTFTHWLVTGVDPATSKVEEGTVPVDGTEGRNDFGDTGYGGPCPPAGAPHRYVFTVEALDAAGNIVGSGQLTTTYGR